MKKRLKKPVSKKRALQVNAALGTALILTQPTTGPIPPEHLAQLNLIQQAIIEAVRNKKRSNDDVIMLASGAILKAYQLAQNENKTATYTGKDATLAENNGDLIA